MTLTILELKKSDGIGVGADHHGHKGHECNFTSLLDLLEGANADSVCQRRASRASTASGAQKSITLATRKIYLPINVITIRKSVYLSD